VSGLSQLHDWPALWSLFTSAHRPPLGPAAFAEACLAHGAPDEAARYAARMPAAEAVPLLLRAGDAAAARAVAERHADKAPELLALVEAHGGAGQRSAN
jgi:hypothetical protein